MAILTKELIAKQLEELKQGLAAENFQDEYGYWNSLFSEDFLTALRDDKNELGIKSRSYDETFGLLAVQYPELHDELRELINIIIDLDCYSLWASDEEQAAAAIARELALLNKEDIKLYARYLCSNDLNHEVYQADDIEEILAKWGLGKETYLLLAARLLTSSGQHSDEQLEEHYEEMVERFAEESEKDAFLAACAQYYHEKLDTRVPIKNQRDKLNTMFSEVFDEVVYYEEYDEEHGEDEGYDYYEDAWGTVVNKFVELVEQGISPKFAEIVSE